jgi:uncharacterized protein (TIGR02302 family)
MQQLAEQMKNNPQQLARPLDRNARVLSEQDLKNMIDRMERMARSGDKDAARALLDQLQSMLENLQMAQPGQMGDSDMQQSMNELGDVIRKQQQLRDRTFKQGQDSRRDRMRGQRGDENAMNDLQRDQQGLRDRLRKLLDDLARQGMMPRGDQQDDADQGQDQGPMGQVDEGDDNLSEADKAMADALGKLGDSDADGAVDSQGKALDSLRRGAQRLADQMQDGDDDGPDGQSGRPGRKNRVGQNRTDPLGRDMVVRETEDVSPDRVPDGIDVQRARRVLQELRRRLGESKRPQVELDYIERLLKDY